MSIKVKWYFQQGTRTIKSNIAYLQKNQLDRTKYETEIYHDWN